MERWANSTEARRGGDGWVLAPTSLYAAKTLLDKETAVGGEIAKAEEALAASADRAAAAREARDSLRERRDRSRHKRRTERYARGRIGDALEADSRVARRGDSSGPGELDDSAWG